MKPIAESTDRRGHGAGLSNRRRTFPRVDFSYQSFSLDRFNGGSGGKTPNSFFDISRDYFQREARRNFRVEVIFFLILAAILAGPFIQGARFIIHFLHLLTA